MTDTPNNDTAKSPSHFAYVVRDGKGHFTRIGAAWPTKQGNGYSLQLDAVPLGGRIFLFVASEKKD